MSVPPSADVDGCVLRNSTTGSRPGSGSGCGLLIPLSSVEPYCKYSVFIHNVDPILSH